MFVSLKLLAIGFVLLESSGCWTLSSKKDLSAPNDNPASAASTKGAAFLLKSTSTRRGERSLAEASSSENQTERLDDAEMETAESVSYHQTLSGNQGQGVRRGYGGAYRRPWGYSSHEWGLGKG